jgi:hypothetical protein
MAVHERLAGIGKSPFAPLVGDSRLQSGITRFQSQWIKTWESWRRLLKSGAGRTPQKTNTASCAAARFYASRCSLDS